MSTPTRQSSTGLLKPTWLFIIAAILIGSGWSINYFFAREGVLRLEAGKAKTLVTDAAVPKDDTTTSKDLGFIITLDSLSIRKHTPEFEIKLWKRDSMPANPHAQQVSAPKVLVGAFPLEPMKINKIEDTDLRFRLKAFYPNFEFAYEYPADRDTIKPKAPGITLELKTKEGTPIVTLRSDQPGKHTVGDIVSLVEKAQEQFDEAEAKKLEKKIRKNQFDFEDFKTQLQQIKKMGNLKDLMGMIPGVGKQVKDLDVNDDSFKGIEAMINSMTLQERRNPDIINPGRKARIAKGAGKDIAELNAFLKQFEQMKGMMKRMNKMPMGRMPGMVGKR